MIAENQMIESYLTHLLNFLDAKRTDWEMILPNPYHTLAFDTGVLGIKKQIQVEAERDENTPILGIFLSDLNLNIGPLTTGNSKPCSNCLMQRYVATRLAEEQSAIEQQKALFVLDTNPLLSPFSLNYIGELITQFLLDENVWNQIGSSKQTVLSINLETLTTERVSLFAHPKCPNCSTVQNDDVTAATLALQPREKLAENEYHLVKATDYDMHMDALINPVCGVLGSTALPHFANTVTAPVLGGFWVKSKYAYHNTAWCGQTTSYEISKYVGLLEGLERYSGQIALGKKTAVFDSYNNISDHALDPRTTGLYQPEFYQRHDAYTPFTPDLNTHWVWGYSFKEQREILIPEQLVYYLDQRTDHRNFVQDCSNGCATGSCIEEAILYGLLELIERDTFLISWYAKLGLPRIDTSSCQNPEIHFMENRISRLGYDVHLYDMRLDLSPPAVMSVAVRREEGLGQLVFAAGASLDPEGAIYGALSEVASYVPGFEERVSKKQPELEQMANDYNYVMKLEDHGLLFGLPQMAPLADFVFQQNNAPSHSVNDLYKEYEQKRPFSLNLLDDLHFCIDEILDQGMDVIVVDQTSPEQSLIGVKTVSVIVPGLMPIDFGWHRKRVMDLPRLRTVPRTAGFRKDDFNPYKSNIVPHPFP